MSTRIALLLLAGAASLGCTSGTTTPPPGDGGSMVGGPCTAGTIACMGATQVLRCSPTGELYTAEACGGGQLCAEGLGCSDCIPGYYTCNDNTLHTCNADGMTYTAAMSCTADEICTASGRTGQCVRACDEAIANRSNLGCEYWAVDLDNEYYDGSIFGSLFNGNAAGAQFAVAIANPSDVRVTVRVYQNDGALGGPVAERLVFQGVVDPNGVLEIPLDQREVDGSVMLTDDGPGTFVSPSAYRVESNYPVVAYQFNPIIQQYSNDASLLIPTSGLDTHYRVIGWPTANPIRIDFPGIGGNGIPDHSFVTIVGAHEATQVTVRLGGAIVGGGGIPATPAGGTVTATLGPYEVLNLESDGIPGDLTGTVVMSSQPVAVFSGGERGIAPADPARTPAPPSGVPSDYCCTDHLEEQVFPTTAWGRDFVVTRSPQRSNTPGWAEPDIYRVMADRTRTTITTNLPGADASFALEPGEWREFYAQTSFTMRADAPVSLQQILVSQQWMDSWRAGHGGDPSMILFPPYQQFRTDYVFLTPSTFSADYVVVAMPQGTRVLIDGLDVNGDEFMALCTYEMVGDIDGTNYIAATCPVEDGPHVLDRAG
ncbi:MAG: IgGFc-binding protein, partial [Sandaracinaceae bacterium]|nr:IgGFc-binding protein [Sandaracinaceae bacterium]